MGAGNEGILHSHAPNQEEFAWSPIRKINGTQYGLRILDNVRIDSEGLLK